jgi:hypothetical protein
MLFSRSVLGPSAPPIYSQNFKYSFKESVNAVFRGRVAKRRISSNSEAFPPPVQYLPSAALAIAGVERIEQFPSTTMPRSSLPRAASP